MEEIRRNSSEVVKAAGNALDALREPFAKVIEEERRRRFIGLCVVLADSDLDRADAYESHRKVVDCIMNSAKLFDHSFGAFGEKEVSASSSDNALFHVWSKGSSTASKEDKSIFVFRGKEFFIPYFQVGPAMMYHKPEQISMLSFRSHLQQWDDNYWNPVSTPARKDACEKEIFPHIISMHKKFFELYGAGCSLRELFLFTRIWQTLKEMPGHGYMNQWRQLFSGGDRPDCLRYLDAVEDFVLRS